MDEYKSTRLEILHEMYHMPLVWINCIGIVILSSLIILFLKDLRSITIIVWIISICLFCMSLYGSYEGSKSKLRVKYYDKCLMKLEMR